MNAIVQQAALALGSGATVAIAGQGIVQIYRGSGVLNFAHGAIALGSAQVFAWAWADQGWPLPIALLLSVGAGAVMGLLVQLLVMRPLRAASQLVRIIATIGVMLVIQQGSQLVFGGEPRFVGSFLPDGAVTIAGTNFQKPALVLMAVAVALTLLLWATMSFSRFGLATRAVAEHELVARSVGTSPDLVAAVNWTIGGALAGLSGVLIVPIGGVAITSILLIGVPAFAAALLGGFRSYLLTTVGAVVIAMGQSIFTFQAVAKGWPPSIAPALPFIVVVVVLFCRSAALPARDEVVARLPRVASTPVPRFALPLLAAAVAVVSFAPVDLSNAIITTMITAIVGLSLVVLTGLSGQISLGQFAIAGIGALAAARVSDRLGWPFAICLLVGVAAATVCGVVFSLPSLRTRGPALAVVTIGLGLAVQQGILADSDITGGFNGATPVERPHLLGLDINAVDHSNRFAALTVALFGLVAIAVATLRRSAVGRRLLAVRNNERAAIAMGISVRNVKVYAFAVASAIAGIGGVLLAFRLDNVQYSQFSFFQSLQLLSFVLIGGIGFVLGPLVGALGVPNGLVTWLVTDIGDLESWLLLGAGLVLITTLIRLPDGLMAAVARTVQSRRSARLANPSQRQPASAPEPQPRAAAQPPGVSLEVTGLSVRFGPIHVLAGVDLRIMSGQITGLIGANGAGKTTLIDTISGFNRAAGGSIRLGTIDLSGESAATRSRTGVARCFQTIELFEDLSVRENLLVATDVLRRRDWLTSFVRRGPTDLDDHARWIVDHLGLHDVLDRAPGELSHGQRRLVGVARALACRPSVLLLDEPTAGLDGTETRRLGEVIRGLADTGLGILLVEHDIDLVVRISDHVVAIDFGTEIYSGGPEGVLTDPAIRRAYLGESDVATRDSEAILQPAGATV